MTGLVARLRGWLSAGAVAGQRRRRRGGPGGRPRRRVVPPLLRPILMINILALGLLVAGVLFLARYEDNLVRAEIDSLSSEAWLIASALGEGAVVRDAEERNILHPPRAESLMRRLAESSGNHLRLYDRAGELILDTRRMPGVGTPVQVLPMPRTGEPGLWGRLSQGLSGVVNSILGGYGDVPVRDPVVEGAAELPEVEIALGGQPDSRVRQTPAGELRLSVAIPVQAYREILGALVISQDGKAIAAAVADVRAHILQVFLVVLALTVALSIYLATTLARPLRRLAVAAERVRRTAGSRRPEELPDFSHRRDEIAELSVALRSMTAELWRRVEATERFAADVAHEIKNPLSSIRSATETLGRVRDPDKQARLLSVLAQDVDRLDRLISDISASSRLDAELTRAQWQPVRLDDLLGDICATAELPIGTSATDGADDRRAVVQLAQNAGPAVIVQGLPERLRQVLENLVANALSFTPSGGTVTLGLNRIPEDGEAAFMSRLDEPLAQIVVDDTGPGLPAGDPARLFQRFYSQRGSTSAPGQHSGLGLAIARQIIEAHGGAIGAWTRYDAAGHVTGARFVVELPRRDSETAGSGAGEDNGSTRDTG